MSEQADVRIKRLAMRSWRRGTKEMDLLLGPFADAVLPGLGPDLIARYDDLLEENDQDLYLWTSGQREAPAHYVGVLARVRGFHGID